MKMSRFHFQKSVILNKDGLVAVLKKKLILELKLTFNPSKNQQLTLFLTFGN